MVSERLVEQLKNEAARLEEDSDFTARGHYNAASRWRSGHRWLGVVATIFSAITATAALRDAAPEVIVASSVVAGVLTAVLTFLKPSEEADRHHRAADQSLAIRNRARFFRNIEVLQQDKTDRDLTETLRVLTEQRNEVLAGAPIIPRKAFEQARKDVEAGTTTHAVDSTRR
jgi:hypothetical protein